MAPNRHSHTFIASTYSLLVIGIFFVAHFLGQAGFTSMSKISPTAPTVKITLGTCWVHCCQWKCLDLRWHGIHYHIHLCQLCHDCWFGTGKDCIGLCQYFQIVTLHLHSLDDSVKIVYSLVVPFWWGWRYTVDIFYCSRVYPLSYNGDCSPLLLMITEEKCFGSGPFIEVGGLMSPLSDFLIEGVCMCQKGDPFGYHNPVGNRLPSRRRKWSPLFQFLD